MNKAEQAMLEEARRQAALRWPTEADPKRIDVEAWRQGASFGDLLSAWTFNVHSGRVTNGCTSGLNHNREDTTRTCSQGAGGPWYETKREAALAMRWAASRECAMRLRAFDRQIEDA